MTKNKDARWLTEDVLAMLEDWNKFPDQYELISRDHFDYLMLHNPYSHSVEMWNKQAVPPFATPQEGENYRQFTWSIRIYMGHLLSVGLATAHTYHMEEDKKKYPWARHELCSFIRGTWKPEEGYFVYHFTVGCQHKNTEEYSPRMFEHRVTCKDCGYKWGYDSSG